MSDVTRLEGVIPPMTTPFTEDGDVDEAAFRHQVRFLIDHGVHGLAVGGSTGEGHALSTDELRRLTATAVEEAEGRVPVIAGIIVDSTREAIHRAKAVADLGVVALQVTPVHYLFQPSDDATVRHFRAVSEEVGVPIIIYNVIRWNYLSPALLARVIDEVPGVAGVKQSAGDLKLLADLLLAVADRARVFSAVDALLYPSFALGAHGTIAALPTAVPGVVVDLWNAVRSGEYERALDLHRRLLPLWNAMVGNNLPACVKYVQSLQGCPFSYPRAPMDPPTEAQKEAMRKALDGVLVAR